jgi:hypothetical protein
MWSAYLFQTVTGRLGPKIAFESVSWSIELNGIESIELKLMKAELPSVDVNYWLSPWWAGVALFWNEKPVVAGPILARPAENFDFITVNCGGIRSILAKRYLVDESLEAENWVNLAPYSVTSYSGLSLGTIVKRVVQDAQKKKGGMLPISYALEDMTGVHERNYRGFNVANLNVDDILTKLSNVLNGPDIMFKPRLLRPGQITFDLWTGTDIEPRIYQKQTPVWDTTPEKGEVSDMNVITTGTYQLDRVFGIGPGQDEGTMIVVATNVANTQKQFPLLEGSYNYGGGSESKQVVGEHTMAQQRANQAPLQEFQMTVRGDGVIGFGDFWPGDLVEIVTKGWVSVPDGAQKMRLLSITGDHTNNVKISLQREDKFTANDT